MSEYKIQQSMTGNWYVGKTRILKSGIEVWTSKTDITYTMNKILEEREQYIAELEEKLEKAIIPKFNYKQVVYVPIDKDTVLKGEIDVYDLYTNRYFVFFPEQGNPFDMGNEWCYESEIFTTRKQAEKRLK